MLEPGRIRPLTCCHFHRDRPDHLATRTSGWGPGRVKTQPVLWFPLLNRGGMMRGFVQGADRNQTTVFPESLDYWVGVRNLGRAVEMCVETADLRDLGFDGGY